MINEIKEVIIKMSVGLAEALCEANEIEFRVVKQDNIPIKKTADYRKDRLNVTVEKGFVVAAYIG